MRVCQEVVSQSNKGTKVGEVGWCRRVGDSLRNRAVHLVALFGQGEACKREVCLCELPLVQIECYPRVCSAFQELTDVVHVGCGITIVNDVVYNLPVAR